MWGEMGSDTKTRIYIRLLDEGTDVFRPADAVALGEGVFQILPSADYDPEDETWEFPPGSVVEGERFRDTDGEHWRAVRSTEK
jgi:hypothetical protein